MCGIAGVAYLDGRAATRDELAAMARAIAHRGPDGEGLFARGPIGLAHRRLAIIDLATGDQPMERADLGLTVVFNGEIYNYVELRAELEGLGHHHRTRSDTEVLLTAYAQWGDAMLPRLNGMFAFAIWDERERRLLLARDALGKKPLVFMHEPGRFAFASEAKALLEIGGSRRAEPAAIEMYLDWMYVPEPMRVWRDIERLPPGSWVALKENQLSRGRWFVPRTVEEPSSFEDATERTAALLRDATRIRLRSDVPLGIFLSGGVDSTLVARAAAAVGGAKLRVFTVGFDGEADERPFAEEVARSIGAEHTELDIALDGVSLAHEAALAFDEPFGDTSAVPTLAMSRATKPYATVVLGGDGGDELFGGYDTYLRHLRSSEAGGASGSSSRLAGRAATRLRALARSLPSPIARRIAQVARPFRANIDAVADAGETDALAKQASMMRVAHRETPDVALAPLLAGRRRASFGEIVAHVPRGASPIREAMLFDQLVYLPGDILKKVDIASMRAGLEVRAPLLDDRIADLARATPVEHHVQRMPGRSEEHWRKRILKTLCAKEMGAPFTYRKKAGFALPLQDWLDRPAFQQLAGDGFASPTSPIRPWFRGDAPRLVWQDFRAGKRWLAQEVWNLIMLDGWARAYRPSF